MSHRQAEALDLEVLVETLPHFDGLELPRYETDHAAGLDLRAAVEAPVSLEPGRATLVPTGLRLAIPPGFEAQVRPRSGLALKHGVGVLNSPGTIDADYRGELKVILFNFGDAPFQIARGERIAQLVFARVERAAWRLATELPPSERGAGGFGSTGKG